ncbi:MAG: hypothetical protein BWX44_00031 [Spirochaetes bacterium ADurb.Bin001]|nr:MAG: hypothetical protein BWX44_00031 [Spirochaetes bacterium ADurb.Bin001]
MALALYPAAVNSPIATLSADITDNAVTIPFTGTLPDAPNIATIGSGNIAETIYYAANSGNQLTGVIREFDKNGTVGAKRAWSSGTTIQRRHTAYDHDVLRKGSIFPVYNIEGYGAPKGIAGDATAYIQAAVDSGEIDIWLPPGIWRITSPINATNRGLRGIRFHGSFMGSPNSSNDDGTVIIADTGGILFDFTGTSGVGFEHIKIHPGTLNPSTIGMLFARCASWSFFVDLRNTTINMADLPTANPIPAHAGGGYAGSIAIYNVESEQIRLYNTILRANTPLVLTNMNIYEVDSPFQTIAYQSTMSHVSIEGATEIWSISGPGIVLENTHTIKIDNVYFYCEDENASYAIKMYGNNQNIAISGNIESFDHLLSVEGITITNSWGTHTTTGRVQNLTIKAQMWGVGHLIYLKSSAGKVPNIQCGEIFFSSVNDDGSLSLFASNDTVANVQNMLIHLPCGVSFGNLSTGDSGGNIIMAVNHENPQIDLSTELANLVIGMYDFIFKGRRTRISDTEPTSGTWNKGDRIDNFTVAAGGKIGKVCTTSGTNGTLVGVTGSITKGSAELTVNTVANLKRGMYITITGVTGVKKITAVNGLVCTLDSNANATVTGAAVAYSPAVFKTWGTINT